MAGTDGWWARGLLLPGGCPPDASVQRRLSQCLFLKLPSPIDSPGAEELAPGPAGNVPLSRGTSRGSSGPCQRLIVLMPSAPSQPLLACRRCQPPPPGSEQAGRRQSFCQVLIGPPAPLQTEVESGPQGQGLPPRLPQRTEGSGPRRVWVTWGHPRGGEREGATACGILAGGQQGDWGQQMSLVFWGAQRGFPRGTSGQGATGGGGGFARCI